MIVRKASILLLAGFLAWSNILTSVLAGLHKPDDTRRQEEIDFANRVHNKRFLNSTNETNPTLKEVSAYAEYVAQTYSIPSLLIKAILLQASGWKQFEVNGDTLTSPGGRIGIMQVSVSDLNAQSELMRLGRAETGLLPGELVEVDIGRLKTDWRYNLEIGARVVLQNKQTSTAASVDPMLFTSWYYALAHYDGFQVEGINDPENPVYSRQVRKNSDLINISVFPYQECIYNIVTRRYELPKAFQPFFKEEEFAALTASDATAPRAGSFPDQKPESQTSLNTGIGIQALTLPNSPTNLTATVLNNTSIALYWHDNSAGTNEAGFKIERRQGSGDWQQIATTPANSDSFSNNYYADTSVSGSNYSYRIRAYNSVGNSGYSNEAVSSTVQVSTGFDYPVGNTEGTGPYIQADNRQTCSSTIGGNNWYVYKDVTAPDYTDHTGEDWNGACGSDTDRNQPVYAASLGRVVYAGYVPSVWGNIVIIAHKLPMGEVIYTQYAHLERIDVAQGATVTRRQPIGTIGKGAANFSAHLHFEVRRVTVGAGNWPVNSQTIRNQYFNPTSRTNNTWSEPGFIEGHRNLSGGGCADTGEPNDSFSQAYAVSCNATTQAKICSATDIDYYRFTPSGSGNSTITLTPPSDKDYDLFVYNSGLQLIGSSVAGTGTVDSTTVSVSSGQTYYIKVIGYSGAFSTTHSYGMGVSCPSGGTTPTVSSFTINNGAASTTSQNATLNNSATGSPAQYQASESSSFSGASWLSYSTAPSFTLGAGTGTKTVYFRVRNGSGIISSTVSDTISLGASGTDNSSFVADVTIPDNTRMNPGQIFTKVWRLRNAGTTFWGSGYSLAFVGGSQMNAPFSISVPNTAPGATVDISVPMTAPATSGTYQGNWRLRNPAGQLFGVEVWVRIAVAGAQPISWEFNSPGDFEGWSCINIQAASVNSGALFVDFAGADPYVVGPGISASASTYRYVQFRMASNASDSAGKIYFKTASENFFSEDKTISFFVSNCSLCGNASFLQYSVFMGGNAKWSGTITGIRIDPAINASSVRNTDAVGFDYIRLSPVQ